MASERHQHPINWGDDHSRMMRSRTRVHRRPPSADDLPDEATSRYIRQIAAEHRNATPVEVHRLISEQGRRDITVQMVRAVLA